MHSIYNFFLNVSNFVLEKETAKIFIYYYFERRTMLIILCCNETVFQFCLSNFIYVLNEWAKLNGPPKLWQLHEKKKRLYMTKILGQCKDC